MNSYILNAENLKGIVKRKILFDIQALSQKPF